MTLDEHSIKNWVPYKLLDKGNGLFCEWLYVGDKQFEEPFFEETIRICKRLPGNRERQKNVTDISALLEWSKNIEAVQPAAFIFHVSRCGSTMVSQLLATRNDHIVLSEGPFFDDILRMTSKQGFDNAALFTEALKFYSQKRNGSENSVFIKLDSWHILFQKEIRRIFPYVPFILMYRSPGEVVRSLHKTPGIHCIPQFIDPEFFGIQDKVITSNDFYNYPARIIEKYMEAYVDVMATDSNAFLLNYSQGMLQIVEAIGNITGITFSEDEWQKMKERLLFHSKYPGKYFSEAPMEQSDSEKFLKAFKLYHRLEELRTVH
jgi:hypothetical protein